MIISDVNNYLQYEYTIKLYANYDTAIYHVDEK